MHTPTRRAFLSLAALGGLAAALPVRAGEGVPLVVYHSPTCGCCGAWADHVEAAGFRVRRLAVEDVAPLKDRFGVDGDLRSCHTAVVGGYVIEGHVPADDIRRLLAERPAATGLAVPGMPMGSPGMEGGWSDPYEVVLFAPERRRVFARY